MTSNTQVNDVLIRVVHYPEYNTYADSGGEQGLEWQWSGGKEILKSTETTTMEWQLVRTSRGI